MAIAYLLAKLTEIACEVNHWNDDEILITLQVRASIMGRIFCIFSNWFNSYELANKICILWHLRPETIHEEETQYKIANGVRPIVINNYVERHAETTQQSRAQDTAYALFCRRRSIIIILFRCTRFTQTDSTFSTLVVTLVLVSECVTSWQRASKKKAKKLKKLRAFAQSMKM